MPEENQKQYEITLILSPDLREEEINLFQEEFKKNIEKLEGSLKKTGKPEKRSLSYPIKKFQSGYYLIVNFIFNPEKLEELYSVLKHKKEILRYIVVFAPEEKPRPFPEAAPPIDVPKEKVKEKEKAETKVEKKTEKKLEKKGKIQLEEIDKKLDEILGM
jgi:small subunit ribosomal protein S6